MRLQIVCAMAGLLLSAAVAAGVPAPRDLDMRAGFDQHVGAVIPMSTRVTDTGGQSRTLTELAGGKPLLMSFGYYRCPNLCDLTLHGMGKAFTAMKLDPAKDYRVVFVSIDPRETSASATEARDMLERMEPGAGARHWVFATAAAPAIAALTGAAGFRYFLDTRNGQYAHPAGLVVVTPGGRISQYFFGVGFDPGAVRLALINASGGHLGTVIDRLVLLCCGYDPATGRYSVLVSRIMMVLGCGFIILMLGGGMVLRRRSR
jgi:protein SCO1/2